MSVLFNVKECLLNKRNSLTRQDFFVVVCLFPDF